MIRWLQTFPYFFKEALIDMRENRAVSTLTVVTTTISLTFLGALWIVQVNVSHLISNWLERFQVAVFLRDDVSAEQKNAVRKILAGAEAVGSVRELTSAQALAEFRRQLGKDADVLGGLEKMVLPFSFRVFLKPGWRNLDNIESLMTKVRGMPGVEQVRNDLVWLRRLEGAIQLLRLGVWTLSSLLGLGVLFIIANTIRLTLFARKDDISVMHLVGATDGFIKTPYVTEGVLCGSFGGGFAYIVLWLVYHGLFQPVLASYSGGGDILVPPEGWSLGIFLVAVGALLGLLGSSITVGRYLREQRD
ncbi:MAG: ABC transporter permease [bacterium]